MSKFYKLTVVFKDKRFFDITTQSDENPYDILMKDWKKYKKVGALAIGQYIFDINEIIYIKVEGDKVEERAGKEVQNNKRKKVV